MAAPRKTTTVPAAVKQPQDHLDPAPKDVTVEWEGNEYTAPASAFGDYRTFRLLSKLEKKPAVIPDLLDRIIGEEQHEALVDASEDEDGNVPIDRIGEFLKALFEAAGQGNS